MTAEQRQRVEQLALEHSSVFVREELRDGTLSVEVWCYDTALPELCVECGLEMADHLVGDGLGHPYRMPDPVAEWRVAPSGFRQLLARKATVVA